MLASRSGAAGAAVLAVAHVGAYAALKAREASGAPGEPQATLFSHALSLARLGFLGPDVFMPPTAAHFLAPYVSSVFVNTSLAQLAANVAGSAWFAYKMAATSAGRHPLVAALGVYLASGAAAGAYATREHVQALRGWLRIGHPEVYEALEAAGDEDGLSVAAARAALDTEDSRLIAFYPYYGALPAVLGTAAFTALDLARRSPLYAAAVTPLLASAVAVGSLPAPDVPPFVADVNALLGSTTYASNAVGVGAGAACWAAWRVALYAATRGGARAAAAKAAAPAAAKAVRQ